VRGSRFELTSASFQSVGDLDGSVKVLGVHSSGKTVGGRVTDTDGLLLVLELGDGAHGAEDLLLHDFHVLGHAGEDGGLDEVALVALAGTADLDLGAGVFALLDVAAGCD